MYLAVSGNIGSGKSTLTRLLAQHYGVQAVYEPHAENPYLADFYQDTRRYAFPSQLYFLSRRLEQHLQTVAKAPALIQDRTLYEDAQIFARNLYRQGYIEKRDWETYWRLYQSILPVLRVPDLLIYIEASLETLQRRIQQRGRDYEKALPVDYLENLNRLYLEWTDDFDEGRILRVNADQQDFLENKSDFEQLCQNISQRLEKNKAITKDGSTIYQKT